MQVGQLVVNGDFNTLTHAAIKVSVTWRAGVYASREHHLAWLEAYKLVSTGIVEGQSVLVCNESSMAFPFSKDLKHFSTTPVPFVRSLEAKMG